MYGHQRRVGCGVERLLGLLGRPRPHPPEPVRDAVHVRVDADVVAAAVNARISTRFAVLRPTPGSVSSSSIVAGHDAAEALDRICVHVCLHVRGLVPVEAHRVDQLLDLGRRSASPSSAACAPRGTAAATRRRSPHPRLRREHRRNEDLERILLLLLGDLLDGRQLEPVDGASPALRITAGIRTRGTSGSRWQAARNAISG